MKTVTYYLLTNQTYYSISLDNLMEYSNCHIAQLDKLVKYNDAYVVEYDTLSFKHILSLMRYGNPPIVDQHRYDIAQYLIHNVESWVSKYMNRYTDIDRIINIRLISNGRTYQVLYSTLCRFPNSVWCIKVSGKFLQESDFDVDMDEYIFEWILDLYRGVNHPYTMPVLDIPSEYLYLADALLYLGLPDGITSRYDTICVKQYCKKCMFINVGNTINILTTTIHDTGLYVSLNIPDNCNVIKSVLDDICSKFWHTQGLRVTNPTNKYIMDPIQSTFENIRDQTAILENDLRTSPNLTPELRANCERTIEKYEILLTQYKDKSMPLNVDIRRYFYSTDIECADIQCKH